MNFSKNRILLIGGGALLLLVITLLFTGVIPGLRSNTTTIKGDLLIWGVYDAESVVRDTIVADFQNKNKNIRVTYVQKDPLTYEQDLVNALAAGTGPDVFYFKNTWLPKHGDKLLPVDPKVFPVQQLKSAFPEVVAADFSRNNLVYALPLYVDTMALFYNKTIFNNAGIALPPQTWNQFIDDISRITRFDRSGRIIRAGAAIGSSAQSAGGRGGINEATDLLNLVMLQYGSAMVTPDLSRASFGTEGADAISFYTSFANPRSSQYTWDSSQHYSLDAFAEESVGMIFNYAYQIPQLKAKNPFLNFSVAPMPQRANAKNNTNYANYFGLAVSNRTKLPDVAMSFMLSSTLDPAINGAYLNAANRPPALLTLINPNINDPDFGLFVRQSLTAKSWPQIDAGAIDQIFTQMLNSINTGQRTLDVALKQAEESISALMRKKSAN